MFKETCTKTMMREMMQNNVNRSALWELIPYTDNDKRSVSVSQTDNDAVDERKLAF